MHIRFSIDRPYLIFSKLVNRILSVGTEFTTSGDTHIIRILNLIALLTAILEGVNGVFYFVFFNVSPVFSFGLQGCSALLYSMTIVWNYFKLSRIAKFWIYCALIADYSLSSTLLFGNDSNVQWHLIPFIPLVFLLWSKQYPVTRYLVLAACTINFFMILQWDGISFIQLTEKEQKQMAFSVFLNVSIFTGLVSYLFDRDNDLYRKKLTYLASYDALTGLLNRRQFEDEMERQLRALQPDQTCALLIFDIDYFKEINDQLGHAAGDKAICHLATILGKTPNALVGRLGGDEFCMFFKNTQQAFIESFATSLLEELEVKPVFLDEKPVLISISVGITLESKRRKLDRIFASADDALYEVKRHGKGTYHIDGSPPET